MPAIRMLTIPLIPTICSAKHTARIHNMVCLSIVKLRKACTTRYSTHMSELSQLKHEGCIEFVISEAFSVTANSIDEAVQQQDTLPDALLHIGKTLYIGKTTASRYIDRFDKLLS
eukprot:1838-Heterococcus_DN1.PRE.1